MAIKLQHHWYRPSGWWMAKKYLQLWKTLQQRLWKNFESKPASLDSEQSKRIVCLLDPYYWNVSPENTNPRVCIGVNINWLSQQPEDVLQYQYLENAMSQSIINNRSAWFLCISGVFLQLSMIVTHIMLKVFILKRLLVSTSKVIRHIIWVPPTALNVFSHRKQYWINWCHDIDC